MEDMKFGFALKYRSFPDREGEGPKGLLWTFGEDGAC